MLPFFTISLRLSLFVSLPPSLSSPPLSTVKPRFLLRRAESSVFITLSVPDRILQADSQTHELAVIVAAIMSCEFLSDRKKEMIGLFDDVYKEIATQIMLFAACILSPICRNKAENEIIQFLK